MAEIRVNEQIVQEALASLKHTAQNFEADLTIDKGKNQMQFLDKIEEINQMILDLVNAYRELLLKNENDVQLAIEKLKAADKKAASGIIEMM